MVPPALLLPTLVVKPKQMARGNATDPVRQLHPLIQLIMGPPVLEQPLRQTFVVKQIPEVPVLMDALAPMLNPTVVAQREQHHLIQVVTTLSLLIKSARVREQLGELDHIVMALRLLRQLQRAVVRISLAGAGIVIPADM